MAKQAGSQSEIGSVSVGVSADTTKLRADLNQAKGKVQEFGAETKAQTEKASRGFDELTQTVGRSVRSSVTAITRLIGSITAAIGVMELFYAIGNKVGEMFDSASYKTERFVNSLSTMGTTEKDIEAISERIATLQSMLQNDTAEGWVNLLRKGFVTPGQAREEVESLQRIEKSLRAQRAAQETRAKEAKERQAEAERLREEQEYALAALKAAYEYEQFITAEKKRQVEHAERIRDIQEQARRQANQQSGVDNIGADITRIRQLMDLSVTQRFPQPGSSGG